MEFRISKKNKNIEVKIQRKDPFTGDKYDEWREVNFKHNYSSVSFSQDKDFIGIKIPVDLGEILENGKKLVTYKNPEALNKVESNIENLLDTVDYKKPYKKPKRNTNRLQNNYMKSAPNDVKMTEWVQIFGFEQSSGVLLIPAAGLNQQATSFDVNIQSKYDLIEGSLVKIGLYNHQTKSKDELCKRTIRLTQDGNLGFNLSWNIIKQIKSKDVHNSFLMVEISVYARNLDYINCYMPYKDNFVRKGFVYHHGAFGGQGMMDKEIQDVLKTTQKDEWIQQRDK